jgi:hypothetical protein
MPGLYSREQREAWAPSVPDEGRFAPRLAAMTVLVADDETGVLGFMALDTAECTPLAVFDPVYPSCRGTAAYPGTLAVV